MLDHPDERPPRFPPDEITTHLPTRAAPLKWVVIVNDTLPAGLMINAAACVAAATGAKVEGMVARGGRDGAGSWHPGLPWAGCTVFGAGPEQLAEVRARATAGTGLFVVDMPAAAQSNRVYDAYLEELATTPVEKLAVGAVGIVGPRNRVDKITKRLALLP